MPDGPFAWCQYGETARSDQGERLVPGARTPVYPVCHAPRRDGLALLLGSGSLIASARKAPPFDVSGLLSRLADSVMAYYARAQSIICDETVSLQSLGSDLISDASPSRRLLFELRVSWEPQSDGGVPQANVLRTLLRVNNRAPREKDRDACMDPKSVSPEPLAMFLPANQADYTFTAAGRGKVSGRAALMVDYRSRQAGPVTATRKDDCFSIGLPGRTRGRVWIDEETADVLRLDERSHGHGGRDAAARSEDVAAVCPN